MDLDGKVSGLDLFFIPFPQATIPEQKDILLQTTQEGLRPRVNRSLLLPGFQG